MSYFYTHFDILFHTGGLHNRTEDLKLWRKPASTVCLFEPNPTHCTIGSNAIQSSSLTDCIDLIRRIRVQAYLNRLLHNKIIHVYSCAFFLARTTNHNVYRWFDEFKCTLALLLNHENEKLDCHFFKCSTKMQLTYILNFFYLTKCYDGEILV